MVFAALLFSACHGGGKAWPNQLEGSYPILGRAVDTSAFFANAEALRAALGSSDISIDVLEWSPGASQRIDAEKLQLFYLLQGEARWQAGRDTQSVKPGMFILQEAGKPHQVDVGSNGLRVLCVSTTVDVQVPAGGPVFLDEDTATRRATATHPPWLRGTGPNGLAADDAHYYYTQVVGAKVETGWLSSHLSVGTLSFEPGVMYPAHNHPAAEMYYVVEGEADWAVDDQVQKVGPGSILYDRPYAVHGWKNRSPLLKTVWIWWANRSESGEALTKPALFTNPELAKDPATARIHAVPIPKPH